MIHFYCSPLEQDTLKVQKFFFLNNVQMKMVHSPISSDTENIS